VGVRRTIVVGGTRDAEDRLFDPASVPSPVESDFCRRQDALDRVGRDLATTALASCDPTDDVAGALAEAAGRLDVAPPELARALLDRTLADPRFAEIPPRLALRAQLDVFAGAAGVAEATLWIASRPGSVTCLASSSGSAAVRRLKVLARTTIEDDAVTITGTRSPILGVPVRRNGASCGTLAVRLHTLADRGIVEPLAQVAARRLSAVLERQLLLEHGESRARVAAATTERRLVRTGYDLHDGPLQALAVLADELRLVSADVGRLVPLGCRDAVAQALANIHEHAANVEYQIREIAQSLETSAVVLRPLTELLEREAAIVSRRSGIEIVSDIRANLAGLTDSQRIVLYRGVQEALSNVARHSGASTATICVRSDRGGIAVTIRDDGCGFDSARALPAAAKRGRLGLVGVAERARLLGGFLTVQSVPGAGTSIKIVIPAWSPLGAASGDGAQSS
jgi:signal transduction histidine kinase